MIRRTVLARFVGASVAFAFVGLVACSNPPEQFKPTAWERPEGVALTFVFGGKEVQAKTAKWEEGYMDSAAEKGNVHAWGWFVHPKTHKGPDAFLIVNQKMQILYAGPPNVQRPDLVNQFKSKDAINGGFSQRLPAEALLKSETKYIVTLAYDALEPDKLRYLGEVFQLQIENGKIIKTVRANF